MLIKHRGHEPVIESSAFVAPTATVVGQVRVGPMARVMYGAVLDSEGSGVDIGECTIVCENAVLRATAAGDEDHPVSVGDHVFVGPHSTLLGCTVEPGCYIAANATVLQGARVHAGSVVAVGALVHANSVVPAGHFIPPYTIAVGNPIRLYSPADKDALVDAIKGVGFAKVAFNVGDGWEDQVSRYRKIAEVRSREFESHLEDTVLSPQQN